VIKDFAAWMDQAGYPDMNSLCVEALKLLAVPTEIAATCERRMGKAFRYPVVESGTCTGCST